MSMLIAVDRPGLPTDSRPVDPWVVQVALSSFDKKDLEVVVKVCQSEGVLEQLRRSRRE